MPVVSGAGTAANVSSAASALSFYFSSTASVLKPDVDSIDGGWLNQSGGSSLFDSLDETVPDDGDYIMSLDRPSSPDVCKISLGNPTGGIIQPLAVMYRYRRQGPASMNLGVRLLQGTTQIAAWTHTDISATAQTVEQVLTGTQFGTISDPTNLFIEFSSVVVPPGPPTLAWATTASDNTPDFNVGFQTTPVDGTETHAGDLLRLQRAATGTSFASPTDYVLYLVQPADLTGATILVSAGALADGVYDFRARLERGGVNSAWSSTVAVTINVTSVPENGDLRSQASKPGAVNPEDLSLRAMVNKA